MGGGGCCVLYYKAFSMMSKMKLATTIEETKTKIIVFGCCSPFLLCRSASAKRS